MQNGKKMGLYHYIWWPSSHDEWREMSEHVAISQCPEVTGSTAERLAVFKYNLKYFIKKALIVSSNHDPVIKLQFSLEQDVFKNFLQELEFPPTKHIVVTDNNSLNASLGARWWWRITSKKQDFAYIVQGSFHLRIKTKKAVIEFIKKGQGLEEHHLHGPSTVHINFVKGQGSQHMFDNGDWQDVQQEVNFLYFLACCVYVCVE